MQCDRCHRAMQEIEENSVLIDVCTSCRGSFLDAVELDAFAGDAEKCRAGIAAGLIDKVPSRHPCPRCAKPMTEGGLFDKDYRIEICGGCGGVWFASRQLSRLARVVGDGVVATVAKVVPRPPPPPTRVYDPDKPTDKSGSSVPAGVLTATTKRQKAAKSSTPKFKTPGHLCPSCDDKVTAKDRWVCSCKREWDAFATDGVCPGCHRKWGRVRCPRCGAEATIAEWKKFAAQE